MAPLEKMMEILLSNYEKYYNEVYETRMREKLGLFMAKKEEDIQIIKEMVELLNMSKLDFTNFFRRLADFNEDSQGEGYIKGFAEYLCELSPPEEIFMDFFKVEMKEEQFLEVII
jgi:uncharacterized protein YdiU (UPF0061 family)